MTLPLSRNVISPVRSTSEAVKALTFAVKVNESPATTCVEALNLFTTSSV